MAAQPLSAVPGGLCRTPQHYLTHLGRLQPHPSTSGIPSLLSQISRAVHSHPHGFLHSIPLACPRPEKTASSPAVRTGKFPPAVPRSPSNPFMVFVPGSPQPTLLFAFPLISAPNSLGRKTTAGCLDPT